MEVDTEPSLIFTGMARNNYRPITVKSNAGTAAEVLSRDQAPCGTFLKARGFQSDCSDSHPPEKPARHRPASRPVR